MSMIDVLLIMLVFFMVTSTYLNLDMIPLSRTATEGAGTPADATPVMIRLGADGQTWLAGEVLSLDALSVRLAALPADTQILILPSLRGDTQSLVSLMDTITGAGIKSLRVVRVAAP
ncbi:ExbD/TolR family protein [Loktanella sp. M215]|uniref:ExbD/TolR family protein n=1 Tax=Loktanella sp. M215 TaxID=2675431 RepID=UPI003019146F